MGEFQIYRDHAGRYRFRLIDDSGEVRTESDGYDTRPNVLEAIDNFRRLVGAARVSHRDDVSEDSGYVGEPPPGPGEPGDPGEPGEY